MYKYDRNRQTFNLINALQPVYRNNGGGLFEFDRRKQHETADLIFEALTFSPRPNWSWRNLSVSNRCAGLHSLMTGKYVMGFTWN